jgi:hypothetical protein
MRLMSRPSAYSTPHIRPVTRAMSR